MFLSLCKGSQKDPVRLLSFRQLVEDRYTLPDMKAGFLVYEDTLAEEGKEET